MGLYPISGPCWFQAPGCVLPSLSLIRNWGSSWDQGPVHGYLPMSNLGSWRPHSSRTFSPFADSWWFVSAASHNLRLPSQEVQHQTDVPSTSFLLRGGFFQTPWGISCSPVNRISLFHSSSNSGFPTLLRSSPQPDLCMNFAKWPYSVSAVSSAPKGLNLVSTKVLTSGGPGLLLCFNREL